MLIKNSLKDKKRNLVKIKIISVEFNLTMKMYFFEVSINCYNYK
jgi:hypothetical protein